MMAEAGLDSDNDGYIEAQEVVDFLVSENMTSIKMDL